MSTKKIWEDAAKIAVRQLCGTTLRECGVEYVRCQFCGPNHLLEAHIHSQKHLTKLWDLLKECSTYSNVFIQDWEVLDGQSIVRFNHGVDIASEAGHILGSTEEQRKQRATMRRRRKRSRRFQWIILYEQE